MITPRRRRRALVRWLARFGAALAILLALAWGYAESPTGRRRLRAALTEAIERELGLEAELRYVRLSPRFVPPGIALVARGIELRHPSEGRLVAATRLEVRPSLTSLLAGRLALTRIVLERPNVRLVVRDGALVNGPTLPPASDEPTDLPFERLEVRDATVRLVTDVGVAMRLDDIDVAATVQGGRAIGIDLRVRGGVVHHARGTEGIGGLRVEGVADLDLGIHVARAELVGTSARVLVRDAEIPLPFAQLAEGEVELDADVTTLARTFREDLGVDLVGRVLARGHVRFDQGALLGRARVLLESVAINERGIGEPLELDVTFDERAVTIHDGILHVPHEGGEVGVAGTIGLTAPFLVDVGLHFRHMQLAALLDDLGVTPNAIARWTFDGHASLRGPIQGFRLDGPIDVDTTDFFVSMGPWHREPRERIMGVERGHLRGRVHIDEEGLSFLDLDVVTPRSRLRCDTTISFSDWFSVRATTEHLDLADISPLTTFPLTGIGALEVYVGGKYSEPELDVRGVVRDFTFDGMPLGDVELRADFEQGGVVAHFPTIFGNHGTSTYVVRDLRLDFSEQLEIDADVDLVDVALDDLYRTFHLDEDERFADYHGRGEGRAHAHFTYGFPGDGPTGTLVTQIDVALRDLDIEGYAFDRGHFTGELRWYDQTVGFDGAELDVTQFVLHKRVTGGVVHGTVAVAGAIGRVGALDLSLAVDGIAIEDTEGLSDGMPLLRGEYGIVGRIHNTLEVPRMDLDVNVVDLAWAGHPLGTGRAYVKLTDASDPYVTAVRGLSGRALDDVPCGRSRSAILDPDWPADPPLHTPEGLVPALARPEAFLICGEGLGGALELDFLLGFTSRSPHRGRIGFRDVDLSPFLPSPGEGMRADGRLSATLDLTGGDLEDSTSVSGSLRVDALRLEAGGVAIAAAAPFDVGIAHGTAKIPGAELVGEDTALRLSGVASPTELALALEGRVGTGLFAATTPLLRDASGSTDLRILVRGPISDPEIAGEALFSGLSIEHAALPVPITDVTGRIEFSERTLVLDGITARLGEGRVRLGGSASLDGGSLAAFEITAGLEDVAFRPDDGVEVNFGGNLTASWDVSRELPLVRGRIDLARVRYTRPVSFTPTLGELSGPTRVDVDTFDPDAEIVEFDIEVTQRAPAEVRNELVDLDLRIENDDRPFRIVGTNERPGCIGTLSIPRGFLNFRGTTFEVRRGTIELEDRMRIHPRFDILASTEIRRAYDSTAPAYRIQLEASGDPDEFSLVASSTPALSQQDIMLLLVVGMTSSELQTLQASQLSTTALDALSSLTGIEDRLSDALRVIDEVSLTTTYHPVTNRPEPQLTVGTRITDRLRVTASTGLTTETRSVRATAQFRVDEHTSIQAGYDNLNRDTASTFGNVGVDVRYRLEFE